MHKKLAGDLTSIAHRILQMKNKDDVLALKALAYQVYEKLTVLAYVDEYLETTPNATVTKEELIDKISKIVPNEAVIETPAKSKENETPVITLPNNSVEEEIEQPFAELEATIFGDDNPFEENEQLEIVPSKEKVEAKEATQDDVQEEVVEENLEETESTNFKKTISLEDELEDTISLDIAAEMFEKVSTPKSVNDHFQGDLQIGLNDRIAFVKHLFDGNQEDFNRVISQINTMKTEKEVQQFIQKMVKTDYNWETKEEYEERFMSLITRKFA